MILLSPNDYENIKNECLTPSTTTSKRDIGEKLTESEILKDWLFTREKNLRDSLQNKKYLRQKDSRQIETKKSAGMQTSPIKVPSKSDTSEYNTAVIETSTDDDDDTDKKTPPKTKKKLFTFTGEDNLADDESKKAKSDRSHEEKRPLVKRRRRRPADIYKENSERKRSLREKKGKPHQKGKGLSKFKFIKKWESI